jgi:hypothetical protein
MRTNVGNDEAWCARWRTPYLSANQLIVIGVRANPNPQETVIDFERKCAVVNANAR